MHVQTDIVKGKNRTYRYVRLAESYRDKKGKPQKKVVANLGDLPKKTEENLRTAFKASREGKSVIIAPDLPGVSDRSKVKSNFRYLDVAVLMQMWHYWNLDGFFGKIITEGEKKIQTSDVIFSLVLQRCISPGSKLYAQRWIPTTAIPEILGFACDRFNNTRIHKALDTFYDCRTELQDLLPSLYKKAGKKKFAVVFIDVTDTYFEGNGCGMAERTRTKEGFRNKLAIGIVLMVNEDGYPLRWIVVPGKTKDHQSMGKMVDDVKDLDWLQNTPFVMDRAMGRESSIQKLFDSGLHFLTAVPVNSIESYTCELPHSYFSDLDLELTEESRERDIQLVIQKARELEAFKEVDEHLFVMDLGIWEEDNSQKSEKLRNQSRKLRDSLVTARTIREKLDSGVYKNQKAAAQDLGVTPSRVSQVLRLLKLAPEIQERIILGDLTLSYSEISSVLKYKTDKQQLKCIDSMTEFNEPCSEDVETKENKKRLRLVAYFNPQMYVDQRQRAQEHCEKLSGFVQDLNQELDQAKKDRKQEPTRRKIIRELEKKNYLDAFDVTLTPITVKTNTGKDVQSFHCKLDRKEQHWKRLRQYDGFVLLLAHPDMIATGKEIALMYRAKDKIEKCFESIKSFLKLRPVFSYKDPKVLSHVDSCMLSLLLQRTLEYQLKQAGISLSAPACLEILSSCHLNQMKSLAGGVIFHSVTEPTIAQREILDALNLSLLVDDESVVKTITPRFVLT